MQIKNKILSGFLLLCTVILVIFQPVYAIDVDLPFDEHNVKTWGQSIFPESYSRRLASGSGFTVSKGACSYFSMSNLLVKGGYIDPKEETPMDVITKVESYRGWDASWGHMDGSRVSELESDLQCDSYMLQINQSYEDAKATLKGLYDEGKYLQVCIKADSTSGHYIFIDGWDLDDNMIITDSSSIWYPASGGPPHTSMKWEDFYSSHNGFIMYVNVYSSKSGNLCKDHPSVYDGIELQSGSGASEEEQDAYKDVKSEWELEGMPDASRLSLEAVIPELPMPDSLDEYEIEKIDTIKDSINQEKVTFITIAQRVASFIGIALICYAIFMMIATIFDLTNSFLDFSVLTIITLGSVNMVDKEELKEMNVTDRKGYITIFGVLKRICLILSIGLFMMSGIIFSFLFKILTTLGVLI